jgi:hypothetical protein
MITTHKTMQTTIDLLNNQCISQQSKRDILLQTYNLSIDEALDIFPDDKTHKTMQTKEELLKPEKKVSEESVRDAALVEMGVSYEPHMSQIDESFVQGAEFGAKWMQEQTATLQSRVEKLELALREIQKETDFKSKPFSLIHDINKIATEVLKP